MIDDEDKTGRTATAATVTEEVESKVNDYRTLRVWQAAVFASAESVVSRIDGLVTKTKVG